MNIINMNEPVLCEIIKYLLDADRANLGRVNKLFYQLMQKMKPVIPRDLFNEFAKYFSPIDRQKNFREINKQCKSIADTYLISDQQEIEHLRDLELQFIVSNLCKYYGVDYAGK